MFKKLIFKTLIQNNLLIQSKSELFYQKMTENQKNTCVCGVMIFIIVYFGILFSLNSENQLIMIGSTIGLIVLIIGLTYISILVEARQNKKNNTIKEMNIVIIPTMDINNAYFNKHIICTVTSVNP